MFVYYKLLIHSEFNKKKKKKTTVPRLHSSHYEEWAHPDASKLLYGTALESVLTHSDVMT